MGQDKVLKMIQLPKWKSWWVQSLIALGVALVATAGASWLDDPPTPKENIIRVVGVWVVGMIFQMAHSLHSFHVDRLETKHLLDVIDAEDCLLLEFQSRFREVATKRLSGKPNRVFIDYCRRSLQNSLDVVRSAARGELEVRDHHFDTIDSVLGAFQGCRDRTFRCVWRVEAGEELFDETWREYMANLVDLSRERFSHRRVQIRILFVLTDAAQLERPSFRRVLGFVSAEKGFMYRIILQEAYETQASDRGLDQQYIDFGVYGDHLLFRTRSYGRTNMGVFSDNQAVIETYRQMHDGAMNASRTLDVPSELPKEVSVEQFLDSDSADGVEEGTVGHGGEQ